MTIYILDKDPKKTAEYLDDKSLDRMICDISQILCNVHYAIDNFPTGIPLPINFSSRKNNWSVWGKKCKDNYFYLIDLLYESLMEYRFRLSGHRMYRVLCFARERVPDLPNLNQCDGCNTNSPQKNNIHHQENPRGSIWCEKDRYIHLPLIMPKKYIISRFNNGDPYEDLVASYRNYYQSKLIQQANKENAIYCVNWLNTKWTNRQMPDWIKL